MAITKSNKSHIHVQARPANFIYTLQWGQMNVLRLLNTLTSVQVLRCVQYEQKSHLPNCTNLTNTVLCLIIRFFPFKTFKDSSYGDHVNLVLSPDK